MANKHRKVTPKPVASLLLLTTLFAGGAAWGQSPPDAGRLLEEIQKTAPPTVRPKPEVNVPVPKEQGSKEGSEAKVFVKSFSFTLDAPVVPQAELQKLLSGYTNREVTFTELEEAAAKVAHYLRGKGYFLAKAYMPQQEIVGGVVRIVVMVGKADGARGGKPVSVEMLAHKRLNENVVQGIMGMSVKPGEPLKLDQLERGVMLVNDLPGVTAIANLTPGSTPGTTRVGVQTTEGRLVTGSAAFDTYGNRYTGQGRFIGALNLNDLTGYGDQFTVSGVQAGDPTYDTDGGWMNLWRAGWQVPLGYCGARGGFSYSSLKYRIGEEFRGTDAFGDAQTWSANVAYPLIRGRENNLFTSLVYDYKKLNDKVEGTTVDDKRIHVVTAGLQGSAIDGLLGGGFTAYGLAVAGGNLDLDGFQPFLATDQQTRNTNGAYWKLNANGSRVQNLGDGFSLFVAAQGQYAGENLDTSEQITLGGPTGVRAFPTGEASGDDGALVNVELRADLGGPSWLGQFQASAFYDHGWVRLHANTWDNWNGGQSAIKNSYDIGGGGFGLTLEKSSQYQIKAFWAAKEDNPGKSAAGLDSDGKNLKSRVWVQASAFC